VQQSSKVIDKRVAAGFLLEERNPVKQVSGNPSQPRATSTYLIPCWELEGMSQSGGKPFPTPSYCRLPQLLAR
jgi:hypothetical protein